VACHLHCDRLGNTCPVEVPEASTLCGLIHRVKLKRWLNTSAKLSEMCRLPGNHCAQTKLEHPGASYQWALPDVRLSTRLAGRAREKAGGAGRRCSSFIILRLSSVATWRLTMLQNVILLVFAVLASSFLWWRARFKICRRCRSRIRRWASVCHICRAEQ
jgi:hypothetical protein